MPSPGPVVKWLSEVKPEAIAGTLSTIGFTLWLTWDRFSKLRSKGLEKAYEATKETATPTALPPPAPAAVPPSMQGYESELQALRIQRVHLEAELFAVQESARALRKAHDAATFELAAQAKALYAERGANEDLRVKSAALLAEMSRLRRDGPPSLPPPAAPCRRRL